MFVFYLSSAFKRVVGFIRVVTSLFVSNRLTGVKINSKKQSFFRVLGLVKYERQKIPLPRVTEDKENLLSRSDSDRFLQTSLQQYCLFQFTDKCNALDKKIRKNAVKKDVVQLISILHFLSYKNSFGGMGSASVNIYRPTINSVGRENSIVRQR